MKRYLLAGKSYQWIAEHKPPPYRSVLVILGRNTRVWKTGAAGVSDLSPSVAKSWTASESDILWTGRGLGKTFEEIHQDLPGRSINDLRHKVKESKHASSRQSWTMQELEFLKHSREVGRSWKEIVQELPVRSTGSIKLKWTWIKRRGLI